mmetsp:Transcript_3498/g.7859  ORF Transcript_3498/g.7859 Transcript_3498/m.7859 type:complete len:306 (-) Transcript_3498:381-1298(-)
MKPFGRAATASELHNSFALDQTLLQVLVGICSLIQSVPAGDGLQGHDAALQHVQQDGGIDSGFGSERALHLDLTADHAGDVNLAKSAQLRQTDHHGLATIAGRAHCLVESDWVPDDLERYIDAPATRCLGHHFRNNIGRLAGINDCGGSHGVLGKSQFLTVQVDRDDVGRAKRSANLHDVHADTSGTEDGHRHARFDEARILHGAVGGEQGAANDGGIGAHRFNFLGHLVCAECWDDGVLSHATLRILVERGAVGQLHAWFAIVESALQAVVVEEALADVLVTSDAGRAIATRHDEGGHNRVSNL